MKEIDILNRCIEKIKKLPEVEAKYTEEIHQYKIEAQHCYNADALIKINTLFGEWECILETKKRLTAAIARHVYNLALNNRHIIKKDGKKQFILCTDYLREIEAQNIRKDKINYVDTAGNMFINFQDGFYVLIKGMPQKRDPEKIPKRFLQPTTLKVILLLLLDREIVNWPYRDIAKEAGVALGSVGWIFRDMKEADIIRFVGPKRKQLTKQAELFDRWVRGYTEKLRPKLFRGRFMPKEKDLMKVAEKVQKVFQKHNINWAITGGLAADLLVHHYKGEELVIHAENWQPELLDDLGWLQANDGPITILDGFGTRIYETNLIGEYPIAPAQMVYAELINSGGDRARETADIIYRDYIKETIDKF